jgi:hypothetical protein
MQLDGWMRYSLQYTFKSRHCDSVESYSRAGVLSFYHVERPQGFAHLMSVPPRVQGTCEV